MLLTKITDREFQEFESSRQLEFHDYPREFARLELGKDLGEYGLGWGSEMIEPAIQITDDDRYLWLGIDFKLVAFDRSDASLILSMPLHTPVLEILSVQDTIAVLTELEVILFQKNGLMKCFLGLPDLAETLEFASPNFIVKLFDGTELTVNPARGTLRKSSEKYVSPAQNLAIKGAGEIALFYHC